MEVTNFRIHKKSSANFRAELCEFSRRIPRVSLPPKTRGGCANGVDDWIKSNHSETSVQHETAPFGIKVINVMAAFMDLNIFDRRERTFRTRKNPFLEYSEKEFYRRYRLTKNCARHFSTLISEDLQSQTNRNYSISPELQFLTALRFYATGSYQITTGDTE